MEFGVLGPLRVSTDGEEIDVGGPKARLLLAALVAHRGEPVSQDRLADALWPDSAAGVDTLQSYVSRLRGKLGADRDMLERSERGYRINAGAEVDTAHFEDLAEQGRRARDAGDLNSAAGRLTEALDLWRGPAFGELADENLVRLEAIRLEELRHAAMEDLIESRLGLGDHADVVAQLETLVRSHPLRERLWELYMISLVRSGRQADALRAYQQARSRLADELGIEPSHRLRELESMVLLQDPALAEIPVPPEVAQPDVTSSLPVEYTRFVGRETELSHVASALARSRLVTLTGPPGVGKTRLAVATARQAAPRHPAGVVFVDLSGATASAEAQEMILDAVANAAPDRARMAGVDGRLLLVDNCEHLVDASAETIAALLSQHPDLRVLATSREALTVPGEVVVRVPPMTLPSTHQAAGTLGESDAVALFVERCADARADFEISDANAADIHRICTRLDGVPLALELAAARTATMGLREIARGLEQRFELLTDGYRTAPRRHKTLSEALEWSYQLLEPETRQLFDQLRFFNGDFPSRAVEVVCADDPTGESLIRPLLGVLVRRSLVLMDERDGEAAFRLLPMVTEFLHMRAGWEQGAGDATRGFVLALAQWTEPRLRGTRQQMLRALLDGEGSVARRALELAYDLHDVEDGAFLAGFVAARSTGTGRIGFVGGVDNPFIRRFERGFLAGADHVGGGVEVVAAFVSEPPDHRGFYDSAASLAVTSRLLDRGVDVVFHAAGIEGGRGVFEAARESSEVTGRHRWVVGVDFDDRVIRDQEHRRFVLTSMRRQIPLAAYKEVKANVAEGRPENAPRFGLANEGVGLTPSLSEELMTEIASLSAAIVAGELSTDVDPAGKAPR